MPGIVLVAICQSVVPTEVILSARQNSNLELVMASLLGMTLGFCTWTMLISPAA